MPVVGDGGLGFMFGTATRDRRCNKSNNQRQVYQIYTRHYVCESLKHVCVDEILTKLLSKFVEVTKLYNSDFSKGRLKCFTKASSL